VRCNPGPSQALASLKIPHLLRRCTPRRVRDTTWIVSSLSFLAISAWEARLDRPEASLYIAGALTPARCPRAAPR